MGRKLSAKGKNVQCSISTKKPKKIREPRVKPIKPRKMPNCVYEGYIYHRHSEYTNKDGETKIYLRCKNLDTELDCSGKGEISHEGVFTCTKEHDEDCQEQFAAERAAFRAALYGAIKSRPGNPKDIYDDVAKEHPVAAQFCPYHQVEHSLIKWRNEDQPALPTALQDISDILSSDQWVGRMQYEVTFAQNSGQIDKTTHQLRAWTVHDKDGFVHVVFGTVTYSSSFENAVYIFIDATFDVVPNIQDGYQLLTVMAEINCEVLPTCWALMSRKTKAAYSAVLSSITSNLLPNLSPMNIITDYEKALQASLSEKFPEAVLQGCFFHHCHAILKKSNQMAIMTRAKTLSSDSLNDAKLIERDLMNLAFLPPLIIEEAFNSLKTKLNLNAGLSSIMEPLFNYYENFWIKRVRPDGFSIFQQKRRTNNVLERYHRTLKHNMSTNPEICKFLDGLKRLQEKVHLDLLVVQHNLKLTRKKILQSELKDKNIEAAWATLSEITSIKAMHRTRIIRQFLDRMRESSAAFVNALEKSAPNPRPERAVACSRQYSQETTKDASDESNSDYGGELSTNPCDCPGPSVKRMRTNENLMNNPELIAKMYKESLTNASLSLKAKQLIEGLYGKMKACRKVLQSEDAKESDYFSE